MRGLNSFHSSVCSLMLFTGCSSDLFVLLELVWFVWFFWCFAFSVIYLGIMSLWQFVINNIVHGNAMGFNFHALSFHYMFWFPNSIAHLTFQIMRLVDSLPHPSLYPIVQYLCCISGSHTRPRIPLLDPTISWILSIFNKGLAPSTLLHT